MAALSIDIPDAVLEQLHLLAAERRVSVEVVIREALEEKAQAAPVKEWPKPRSFGMGDSGQSDVARRASDLYVPDPWR